MTSSSTDRSDKAVGAASLAPSGICQAYSQPDRVPGQTSNCISAQGFEFNRHASKFIKHSIAEPTFYAFLGFAGKCYLIGQNYPEFHGSS